jgi:hypothetical protein
MQSLAGYKKIAFDLDGTLIDGVASAAIATFIKRHATKSYFIITFRTPSQAVSIPSELISAGLSVDLFKQIIPISERLMFDFNEEQQQRRNAGLTPLITDMPHEALFPGEYKLMHWKGFVARKLGATVLVDDLPFLVTLGCKKFGIDFIDPKNLSPVMESWKSVHSRPVIRNGPFQYGSPPLRSVPVRTSQAYIVGESS